MACSDNDNKYLSQLVLSEPVNQIDASRGTQFESRFPPIVRAAGASSLEDFVSVLGVDSASQLHRAVAEAMTVNETSFFHDATPFEALRETILPRLIERNSAERRLRIWS